MIPSNALSAVKPEELTRAASIFGTLKQLRMRLTPEVEESQLDQAFESHVAAVLGRLDSRIPELNKNEDIKNMEIIMARHGLYDAAFQQAILLGQAISPPLGDALKDIRLQHSTFMIDMQKIGCTFYQQLQESSRKIDQLQSEINAVENECKSLLEVSDLLDREAEEHQREILELRNKLRSTSSELDSLSIAANVKNNNSSVAPMSPFAKSNSLSGQVFDTSIKKSTISASPKNSAVVTTTNPKYKNTGSDVNGSSNFHATSNSKSTKNVFASTPESWLLLFRSELQRALDRLPGSSASNIISKLSPSASIGDCLSDTHTATPNLSPNPTKTCRIWSYNETIDMIDKFYESKKALNLRVGKKAPNGRSPTSSGMGSHTVVETMEQHVYHVFEKKYGLRSLAVENCSMFVAALDLYSKPEYNYLGKAPSNNHSNAHSVCVSNVNILIFNKIFRNEIDESYVDIHNELVKSIQDLVTVNIINRHPNKSNVAVQELLHKKMSGVIHSEEWTDIVNYLYNGSDAKSLLVMLKRASKAENDEANGMNPDHRVSPSHSPNANASVRPPPPGSPHLLKQNSKLLNLNPKTQQERDKEARRLGYSRSNATNSSISNSRMSYSNQDIPMTYKLTFGTFVQTVVLFQVQSHEAYLRKFNQLFHRYDANGDGVLTLDQYRACYNELFPIQMQNTSNNSNHSVQSENSIKNKSVSNIMPLEDSFLEEVLDVIDVNRDGLITYSNAVDALHKIHYKA